MEKWNVVESKYVFKNKWVKLREDRCLLPNGKVIDYYVFEASDGVVIFPLTKDKKVVLVEQYRHVIKGNSLELPAGITNKREKPIDAAKRELLEETGYAASEFISLGYILTNPSKLNSMAHIYLALNAYRSQDKKLDHAEDIDVKLFDLNKVLDLCINGRVLTSDSLVAMFRVINYLKNKDYSE